MTTGTMTHDEFTTLARSHQRVVVHKILSNSTITALQALEALRLKHPDTVYFESDNIYIAFNAVASLTINEKIDVQNQIRAFYQAHRAVGLYDMPGFVGGLFGFFSYESSAFFEEKLDYKSSDLPAIALTSYQDHLIFDHARNTLTLATISTHYEDALKRLERIASEMHEVYTLKQTGQDVQGSTTHFSDEAYIKAGQTIQQHIKAGDVFQVVLARTFEQFFSGCPISLLKVLKERNPSQYMFLFSYGDMTFCGASPETMVSVKKGMMTSCPLAGTRPRGSDYDDTVQAKDLLSDPKEVSEHMMLVDLARNDLGAVADPGTVKVASLKEIKYCSRVMHLSSTIQARLARETDALDALISTFPAGTLSGAPKLRAMQIIESLEPKTRGLYGGVVGYIDNKGNLDSCIAIRMAKIFNGKAYVTTGAGITADSDLQKEADETRHKAKALLEVISLAQGGE